MKNDYLLEHALHLIAAAVDRNLGNNSYVYGVTFENEAFAMRPDCDCGECDYCNDQHVPNFWHKKSGLTATWEDHIGYGVVIMRDADVDVYTLLLDCLRSLGVW